jgi:hypothetical protein
MIINIGDTGQIIHFYRINMDSTYNPHLHKMWGRGTVD